MPVEEQVVVLYAGTRGYLDPVPVPRCGASRPTSSSGSAPATPTCWPASVTPVSSTRTRIAKAQERVQAARPYADRITGVIRNLAAAGAGGDSPLLNAREEISTIAYVVVAADRGLAGGYNSAVIRGAERAMAADEAAGRSTALITVGKKPTGYFRFRGHEIAASFTGFSDNPTYEDAREVARYVAERFDSGEYSEVHIAYTRFITMGSQSAEIVRYMPLDTSAMTDGDSAEAGPSADYEFEPGPDAILESLLPRYAEARLYSACSTPRRPSTPPGSGP
jgi:F-type H+-transporting ATPase subunit gamma